MKRRSRRWLTAVLALGSILGLALPAGAIHLFPLTPVGDPLGHDCEQALESDPGDSAADVSVVGFNFIDNDSLTTQTTVQAGESVTWEWLADHCHSVTFQEVDGAPDGTFGGPNDFGSQPELVRIADDGGATFTATFEEAGQFAYSCVHHEALGMSGVVTVE